MPMLSCKFSHSSATVLASATVFSLALLAGCATKTPVIAAPAVAATVSTGAAQTSSAASANSGLKRTTPTRAGRFLGILSPYRIDIPQGNFVSEEMLSQIKVGMTPDQVRFALGTPLITDIFHAERWDYVFRMLKSNDDALSSRVTVFFKDGRLSRFEGGNLPSEADYLALIAGAVPKKAQQAAPAPAVAPSAATPTQ